VLKDPVGRDVSFPIRLKFIKKPDPAPVILLVSKLPIGNLARSPPVVTFAIVENP